MTERRPPVLLVVCLLVTVEAAAFLGLGVAWIADVVRGAATMPAASLFLAAFGAGVALLLLLAAGMVAAPRTTSAIHATPRPRKAAASTVTRRQTTSSTGGRRSVTAGA